MSVSLVAVALLVAAAGRPGHADGHFPLAPMSSVSSDGPQEAAETGLEEKATGWLKLKRGTRVRLMVEDGGPMREVAGRLLRSDATTVAVDAPGGPQSLARDRLFHLEYLTGGRDRKKGAAIGAAITGLAGLVAGVVLVANEHQKNGSCDQCGILIGVTAIAGAIPGGAIGFAIGTTGGDWHNAKPDGLTVTGATSPRPATVALQLRFGRR